MMAREIAVHIHVSSRYYCKTACVCERERERERERQRERERVILVNILF